jgi:hypothetical protein
MIVTPTGKPKRLQFTLHTSGDHSMAGEHYRDMAAHFRALAEVEPLASLRRYLRRLAAQHDEKAADLEQQASPTNAVD